METELGSEIRRWNVEHLSATRARVNDMFGDEFEVASAGDVVTTDRGRQMLNLAGYGVTLLGARHPRVVAALREQLDTAGMASRVLGDWYAPRVAHELCATFSDDDLSKVHFVNSGAEAVEAAIKLVRAHGIRRMITTAGAFHGKTTGALSLTANPIFQNLFLPLLGAVDCVPFGDIDALKAALAESDEPTAVILEPVQGESGVRIAPRDYLGQVSLACRERGAVLIMDEIQTGLGRTGRMWAHEEDPLCRPDIVLTGKVLSGGLVPVAAMVATAEMYEPFDRDPFLHTSTYAANPLAMSAALTTLQIIDEEDVVALTAQLGEAFDARLRDLSHEFPSLVREVRGLGCLWGIELIDEAVAAEVLLGMLDRGVLVNHSLNRGSVIRLTPSAFLSSSDLTAACDALRAVLAQIAVTSGRTGEEA